MKSKRNLPSGGHMGGAYREALQRGIELAATTDMNWVQAVGEPENFWTFRADTDCLLRGMTDRQRAQWLTGKLWNCTDTVPSAIRSLCENFWSDGNLLYTYARLTRRVRGELSVHQQHALAGESLLGKAEHPART